MGISVFREACALLLRQQNCSCYYLIQNVKGPCLNAPSRNLLLSAACCGFTFTAIHVLGVDNKLAAFHVKTSQSVCCKFVV